MESQKCLPFQTEERQFLELEYKALTDLLVKPQNVKQMK